MTNGIKSIIKGLAGKATAVERATKAHAEACAALEAQAAIVSTHEADLATATANGAAAKKTWIASQAQGDWTAYKGHTERAEQIRLMLLAEREKLAPLRAAVDETRRAIDLAKLDELRDKLAHSRVRPMVEGHVEKLLAAERAMASAWSALAADLEALASVRAEASGLAGQLGVDADLAPEITVAMAKALIAVAEERPSPLPPGAFPPPAPQNPRDRASALCRILGESDVIGDEYERAFPAVERVAALLAGTYREKKKAASDAIRAAELARRAAREERERQLDREHAEREKARYRPVV